MTSDTFQRMVHVTTGSTRLPGSLTVPPDSTGVVIFAHGSGSGRLSSRNIAVSDSLARRGCATLLFDLLTEHEAADRDNVFDIPMLADRMVDATRWLRLRDEFRSTPIGFFGASTGAAAALVAAAELGGTVAAVVSRGGRPDLAGKALKRVVAPTLLVVGSRDDEVLELNRAAMAELTCEHQLIVIERATHLFEEPGTLDEVARHAGDWFLRHFTADARLGLRS